MKNISLITVLYCTILLFITKNGYRYDNVWENPSFRMLHRVVCKWIIVTLKLFSFAEYIEVSVIHIQLNIYSLVIFLLWSMALFSGDARQSCNGKVVTSHFFFQALIDKCAHTIALTQALTAVFWKEKLQLSNAYLNQLIRMIF